METTIVHCLGLSLATKGVLGQNRRRALGFRDSGSRSVASCYCPGPCNSYPSAW